MATVAIPAVIGLLAALAPLFQKKEETKQFPTMNPQQMGLMNQISRLLGGELGGGLYGQSKNFLQDIIGGDTSKFEAPLMRQFNEQIIPSLAEQFGGVGALSSSGFQQALGSAGAGLAERLGALRGELQLGAAKTGLSSINPLLSSAFQPTFSTGIRGAQAGPLANLIGPIIQAIGGGFGQQFGQNIASKYFK